MANYWGYIMIVIGTLMFVGGFTKSNFILYKILTARSRKLWGDNVHPFYMVSGALVAIVGILIAVNVVN